jgi:asparagine synthase (glutamine-hydrolysing)
MIDRPKEGFVQPVYTWMRGPLRGLMCASMEALPEALFQRRAVKALSDRFLAGEPGLEAKVWNLTCFAIWHSGLGSV